MYKTDNLHTHTHTHTHVEWRYGTVEVDTGLAECTVYKTDNLQTHTPTLGVREMFLEKLTQHYVLEPSQHERDTHHYSLFCFTHHLFFLLVSFSIQSFLIDVSNF